MTAPDDAADPGTDGVGDPDVAASTEPSPPGPAESPLPRMTLALVAVALIALAGAVAVGVLALGAAGGDGDGRAAVAAARQVATDLTTIRAESAEADLQRLLDGSTGEFRAQFEDRRGPFVEIVQQAAVSTSGEVVEAGLESVDAERARVLLAVTSQVENAATPQAEERNYRLAMTLERVDGRWLASIVEFVP